MSVFAAGPWDKKEKVEGAHVFGRKLLYGAEHDSAEHLPEGADPATYGAVELHKLHAFYRRNALKMMSELARRTPKGEEVKMRKTPARSGPAVWPGDLGKHHALIEEMIALGVVTLHQDESAQAYARVHPGALARAIEKYGTTTPAAEAAAAAPSTPSSGLAAAAASAAQQPFLPSTVFLGARTGYIFKSGTQGVGYYADGVFAAAAEAAEPLPDGWVKGCTPEGYTYFWHHETSTSSWERPTGPPTIERRLSISPAAASALYADSRATAKLEDDSGATISIGDGVAIVRGTSQQVGRAQQLIERKAAAVAFAVRALPSQQHGQSPMQPSIAPACRPDYSFASVAGFVAEAAACRETLRHHDRVGGAGDEPAAKRQATADGGALAALAAYGDDDDDD